MFCTRRKWGGGRVTPSRHCCVNFCLEAPSSSTSTAQVARALSPQATKKKITYVGLQSTTQHQLGYPGQVEGAHLWLVPCRLTQFASLLLVPSSNKRAPRPVFLSPSASAFRILFLPSSTSRAPPGPRGSCVSPSRAPGQHRLLTIPATHRSLTSRVEVCFFGREK